LPGKPGPTTLKLAGLPTWPHNNPSPLAFATPESSTVNVRGEPVWNNKHCLISDVLIEYHILLVEECRFPVGDKVRVLK
jgi:hypothetical protein